ncbi:MAG: Na+/H+ antiporter NhaA [Nonlabens sp.]|jgi:Na+/H+ antiporter NhaA
MIEDHIKRLSKLTQNFFTTGSSLGIILLVMVVVAMAWANSP